MGLLRATRRAAPQAETSRDNPRPPGPEGAPANPAPPLTAAPGAQPAPAAGHPRRGPALGPHLSAAAGRAGC